MNSTVRAVATLADPSSFTGSPTTTMSSPSSSPRKRVIVSATRFTASAALSIVSVVSGRASVRDRSLMARPMRRSPTSTPRTRILRCYNSSLPTTSVKRILVGLLVVGVAAAVACRSRPPEKFRQKLVILGFDGMDPRLVQRWMDEGRLPNFKKLAARGGGVHPLETTHSPESPTAWASFATGVNAGKHNIYDFLVRDTNTYLPDLGMVTREPPRFIFNYIPISRPKITSIRGGTSFWVTAGRSGVRSSVLTVPVTYPPEEVPNGELLSGLPLPDIRATMGTFYYFGTDLSRYEEGNTEFGGILKRLVFSGDMSETELIGPPNPIVRQQMRELRANNPQTDADKASLAALVPQQDIKLPIAIHWNKAGRTATIDLGGSSVHLQQGEWSKWIDLDFNANVLVRIHGMAQLY